MIPQDPQLVLEHDNGQVILSSSTLLVGLDETGHEAFADSAYPVFGLGGCAMMVRDYPRLVRIPWAHMKQRYFGLTEEPLHASALRNPTTEQIEALGHFFVQFQFSRLAAIATDRTLFEQEYDCMKIVGAALLERLRHVIKWYSGVTSVALASIGRPPGFAGEAIRV